MEEYSSILYTGLRNQELLQKKDGYSMKWIKRLCSFIFLCLFCVGVFMLWRGYEDCQDALDKMSVQEMGAQIQTKEDYATLEQLPEDYIDAVLAVEDKRFYRHPGIDPIASAGHCTTTSWQEPMWKAAVRSRSSLQKISSLPRIRR